MIGQADKNAPANSSAGEGASPSDKNSGREVALQLDDDKGKGWPQPGDAGKNDGGPLAKSNGSAGNSGSAIGSGVGVGKDLGPD